ncbi:ATP-binding protein [Streptomyces sp. NPDC016845]|uniref:ATP-binding protein n=1 Tax=Streptomyces sp. NPDC016845 TaxID=3364972 RepID=UPI0037B85FF1
MGARGDTHDADHRALSAAVTAVLARLDAHASGGRPDVPARSADAAADTPSALDTLCSCFALTPFERDVLVLAAAAEVDTTTAARCAAACGDPARPYPTFSLALAALDVPHWSALAPVSPLRRWQLVEPADDASLTTARLRIDERILHFLVGVPYLDTRLHGLLGRRVPVPDEDGRVQLPAAHRRAAESVALTWSRAAFDGLPHVELVGADRVTRREVAARAAHDCGLALYAAAAEDLPTEPAERDRLARLWQREAILLPAGLLVESGGERAGGAERTTATAEAFFAELAVPLAISSTEPRPADAAADGRDRVTVEPLGPEEQLRLWSDALDGVADLGERDLRDLVAQFSLPAHVIRGAGISVRRTVENPGESAADAGTGEGSAARLAWLAGLTEARIALDELGRRIEPRADWTDLVLAERQRETLREVVAHVRQRATVYQEWGFESLLRRGLGVTALFAGGSGTGKTLAAEVIANELAVDLFVIDLSQVVSKYIGETEKNLRRVFDAAERGGALLLFDEADALFGKRSEIKDSHDRYANLEVSYLLMRMEAYRGLAVLTTNMKKALDTAFLRRIRFVVDFPFPAVPERAEIWRRVIPERTPRKGIDVDRLAQLTVTGGSIRNIALAGAFLAADEGCPLQMRHMLAATRTEYLKLERSLTPSEVSGWI